MKKFLTILILVLAGVNAAFCGVLPIAPDAWVDSNLKPEYYENVDSQYPNIGGIAHKAILFGSSFDPEKGVLAYDKEDGYINVTVTGTVDTNTPGMQHIQYSATDSDGHTVEFDRKIYVLKTGRIAKWDIQGRFGANDNRNLNGAYQNVLVDDITNFYIDITAPENAEYKYKEIRRTWADGATGAANTNPPDDTEWDAAEEKDFYRDLHIFMDPRVDRWFKVSVIVDGTENTKIFGLKGDPGEIFTSPYNNQNYLRLSREVEDPMTTAEQHKYFAQGVTFGYNWGIPLQKRMGSYSQQVTAGNPGDTQPFASEVELHGEMIFSRFFMNHMNIVQGTKDEWWSEAKKVLEHGFGIEKNRTYRRSYQIPVSESTSGALQAQPREDFIAHVEQLYKYLIDNYNEHRIVVCGPTGISAYSMYYDMVYTNLDGIDRVGFPYKSDPYFKVEFHRPALDTSVLEDFRTVPFYGTFSKAKIKHVSDHSAPTYYFEQLRELVRMSKVCGDKSEIVLQEQFNIIRQNDDGSFKYYALPYVALRHGYLGSHFLNNMPYFEDDWDGDSLSNELEYQIGSNPFNADTDGDWIFDADEYKWGLDITADDADEDKDGDGISNLNEALYSKDLGFKIASSNIVFQDRDKNGNPIFDPDGNPVMVTLNADRAEGRWDCDYDSLPIMFEVIEKIKADSAYISEVQFTDPDVVTTEGSYSANRIMRYINGDLIVTDDADGIDAFTEWKFGLSPDDASDATEDWDGDGVSNADEITAGTSFTGDNSAGPEFNASTVLPPIIAGAEILGNVHAYLDAPDADEAFEFTLVNAPQWISMDAYGNLSGISSVADIGANSFTVKVSAGNKKEVTADLSIEVLGTPPAGTKSISGKVSGDVAEGVSIIISGNGTTVSVKTDSNGNYNYSGLGKNIAYSVSPELSGYEFTPKTIQVGVSQVDVKNVDFTSVQLPAQPEYLLTVSSGSGSGKYQVGEQVTITALDITDMEFLAWSGDTDSLNDISVSPATLVMPDNDVNLKALYKMKSDKTPLSVSGCVLWYDATDVANDGSVPSNGELFEWVDKSPSKKNAVKSVKYPVPHFVNGGLNGKPVVNFAENEFLNFDEVNDIRTVFWVLKEVDHDDFHFFLAHDVTSDFHRGYNGFIWDSRKTSDFIVNGKTYLNGTEIDGLTELFPLGDFKIMSLVTDGNVEANRLTRDRKFGSRTWRGDIAEIIIYNQALNDSDRKLIEDYLDKKWFSGNTTLKFALTVINGSGTGIYEENESVNIVADTPVPGMRFEKWTGDTQYLADTDKASTSLNMPSASISLVAKYVKIENEPFYSVSGKITGDLSTDIILKLDGRVVQIVTVDQNGDYSFSAVPNGSYTVTPSLVDYDFSPASKTVVVAGKDVTGIDFSATSTNVTHFTLTVNNGTGGGSYAENATVPISATVPNGQVFDAWTGDTQYLADASVASTTVSMPAQDVTVTATFKQPPPNSHSISGTITGDITAGVTVAVDANNSVVTDASGNYTIIGLADGTYTVTPSLSGYTFSPATASVTVAGADMTGINFTSTTSGGGGGITDPTDIAGCNLWLDGADPAADGSVVTGALDAWKNKADTSNFAYQVDSAKQPEVVANALNGLSLLRFTGGDQSYPIVDSSLNGTSVSNITLP
jgi:hypothetical protein